MNDFDGNIENALDPEIISRTREVISNSLDKIELSKEKYAEIIANAGSKTLGGKIPILGILLEGVDRITQEVREEKLKILQKELKAITKERIVKEKSIKK